MEGNQEKLITPPKILAFDTATSFCTVAITEGGMADGKILAAHSLTGLTHSRKLLGTIDMLLQELSLEWCDIAGIATGLGPGSFTGLRIGLATAKGLAMASSLPLFGCSTFEIVAAGCGVRPQGERVIVVLDARKQEVYVEGFLWREGQSCLQEEITKRAISPQDLAVLLNSIEGDIFLVGDGVTFYRSFFAGQLKETSEKKINFASALHNQPQAAALGFLGAEQLRRGFVLDVAEVTPLYIRKSDAELNLGKKKK